MAEKEKAIAGTSEGARKALETKRRKYGEDSSSKWGRLGGIARTHSPKRSDPFIKGGEFARQMGKKSAQIRWGKTAEPASAAPTAE